MSFGGDPYGSTGPAEALEGIEEGQQRRDPRGKVWVVSRVSRTTGDVELVPRGNQSGSSRVVEHAETIQKHYPLVDP